MRQKRAKTYKKLMALYCQNFGFRQPYQVLIDSELCKHSVSSQVDIVKQLKQVLQGEVKPMITQCCIHELYLQGKANQGAVDLAKMFERRKCNHREAIPGDDCLKSVVGETNKHRYIIATQSQPLRSKLRAIPGVPLVHINRSVMVLEPPSDVTLSAKETAEEKALHPSAQDLALVPKSDEPPKKKRKGPKGPNPLSVKKKKPTPAPNPKPGEKRKRDAEEDEARPSTNADPDHQSQGGKRKRRKKSSAPVGNVEEKDDTTS
ncbi:Fcf1-domain-containing protein [Cylindrobasidium torrendii FP15055 ss-10]|uniref:U three protein 23 n=1 Tax=Cylindrobasidium torrendii FP15055 ss-10 TaxID=1314674 RepID=A0A0D7BPJ5_9AGAR|nr:Fcf1-domain-containing protein [Cylindrobasidium torrendii FP15055 ss-10]